MQNRYDLTKGNILQKLILVSIPVILTSFVQMAYNMTDLYWLGNATNNADINNGYVAAAGFGGLFTWLAVSIMILVKIGTEVRVSQSVGKNDFDTARVYARTGVQLEFIFALIYAVIIFFFAKFWLGLFNIQEADVYQNAIIYLQIISVGLVFYLVNPVFSASLNGMGNTLVPFAISFSGLVFNMILDPIFIKGLQLGVQGAAIATVISQILVTCIFLVYFFTRDSILRKANFFGKIDRKTAKDILILGIPAAIQSALFTFISMFISGLVTEFGKEANAVQKVGSQIEALSWLTASGIQTSLGAFVGQNFGAGKYHRVIRGVRYALITMTIYGLFISLVIYFFPGFLFSLILDNDKALPLGIDYLKILAFSQLAMIIEMTIGGAFNGLGKTRPASIVGVIFNALRIPMAIVFTRYFDLDLNGIWLAITISSIFKGLVMYIWFKLYIRKSITFKNLSLSND